MWSPKLRPTKTNRHMCPLLVKSKYRLTSSIMTYFVGIATDYRPESGSFNLYRNARTRNSGMWFAWLAIARSILLAVRRKNDLLPRFKFWQHLATNEDTTWRFFPNCLQVSVQLIYSRLAVTKRLARSKEEFKRNQSLRNHVNLQKKN